MRLGLNLQRIDGLREVDDSVEEQPSVVAVTFVTSINQRPSVGRLFSPFVMQRVARLMFGDLVAEKGMDGVE